MGCCNLQLTTGFSTAVLTCCLLALLVLPFAVPRTATTALFTSIAAPVKNNTLAATVLKHSSFLEDEEGGAKYLDELPFARTYHNESLLNITVAAFNELQSQRCFDQRINATTGSVISRSFYRRGSAYFPAQNATEQIDALRQSNTSSYVPVRSACVLTGMLRTYQEVFNIMRDVLFLPTNCDIFISTQGLRGFAQLRFGFPSDQAPYDGIVEEIEREVLATFDSVKHRLKFLHIHPFSAVQGRAFVNESATDGRHFALPLYMHMEAAYQGLLQEESRSGAYEAILHVRPDLWFQYSSPLYIVRGSDSRLRLLRDAVVITLANNTVVVNGRFTAPWRANDHLTFGLRRPMGLWMRAYYFVKYVAPVNSVHSEGGKRVVLNHLMLFTCTMDLRVQAMKQGAERRRRERLSVTNSQWCFRNCSFIHPKYCSKFHRVPLLHPPCGIV